MKIVIFVEKFGLNLIRNQIIFSLTKESKTLTQGQKQIIQSPIRQQNEKI